MFCIKCGSQIKDNSEFCPYCGCRQIISEKAQSLERETGNNVKNAINWCSVFFGPFHAAYYNMIGRWLSVMKESLITEAVGLASVALIPESKDALLDIAVAVFLGGLLWRIIKQVQFGIHFEEYYLEEVQQNPEKISYGSKSWGKAVLTILVYFLIWFAILCIPELPDTSSGDNEQNAEVAAVSSETQAGITEDGVFNMPSEQKEYEEEKAAEQEFAEYVQNHVIVCDGQTPLSFFEDGRERYSRTAIEKEYGVCDEEKEDGFYYYQVYFDDLPGEYYITYDDNDLADYVEWYGSWDDETRCIQIMQDMITYYQEVLGEYSKWVSGSAWGYSINSTETVYSWDDYDLSISVITDKDCMGYRVCKSWEE